MIFSVRAPTKGRTTSPREGWLSTGLTSLREWRMTPEEAYTEAVRRIRAAREARAEVLDLGDLSLAALPDDLSELESLRVLALGHFKPFIRDGKVEWEVVDDRPRK